MQTLYLATHFNPIYWNTACLVVNSGSLEDNSEITIEDIYEEEDWDCATYEDLPDRSGKIKKTNSTDYGKVAKAIGDITGAKIKVSPVDINRSGFGFKPDAKNNQILFGLKGLLNVGDELVSDIIKNRPYSSPKDFYTRVQPKKQAMISLIKSGAFDTMEERKFVMAWYIYEICDKKSRLTLQNMPSLFKYKLIPEDNEQLQFAAQVYEFNRYLKAVCKSSDEINNYYLTERAISFIDDKLMATELIKEEENPFALNNINGISFTLGVKAWDKMYQKIMDIIRNWLNENKDEILKELNTRIFKEAWKDSADGSYSAWEMEVMCFYYHEHELANLNKEKYNYSSFFDLPEQPEVDRIFKKGNNEIKLYKLSKIYGTCIAKNKNKATVTLLTPDGVVEVKFRKEYFSLFDKRISEKGEDGKKHIVEHSWFERGSKIVVTGIRLDDVFMSKKYASTGGHQLYKIINIDENGDLVLQEARYKGEID